MRTLTLALVAALATGVASAQLPDIKGMLGAAPQAGVSEGKAAAGLKDALRVSTGNAVSLTGKPNGYFGNEAIRIGMPQKLQMVEKGLRAIGYGPKVDEFVLSMNARRKRRRPRHGTSSSARSSG